uniref:PAR14-like first RRM domain-containing protein n=1 Tax=Oryzias latipes TaxID=8090 RepID=A0A3P9KXP2_ORYLA
MADGPPVVVEGDWDPSQQKSVKLKLQVYFQSKKKSGGGDCRVELEDDAARVYFRSGEVREEVLKRKNHEIVLEKETFKLKLSSDPSYQLMVTTLTSLLLFWSSDKQQWRTYPLLYAKVGDHLGPQTL